MAFTRRRNGVSAPSSNPYTVSIATCDAGDLILLAFITSSPTDVQSVVDNASPQNTWVNLIPRFGNSSSGYGWVYMAKNISAKSSSMTVTITFQNGAPGGGECILAEYVPPSGTDPQLETNGYSSATGTSNAPVTGNYTSSVADDLHFCWICLSNPRTFTAGSGGNPGTWAKLPSPNPPDTYAHTEDCLSSSASSTNTGKWTLSSSTNWSICACAIKAVSSGQQFTQDVAGAVSFGSGTIVARANKGVAGVASFNGGLGRSTLRLLLGALSFAGSLMRRSTRAVAGSLTFAGALNTARLKLQNIAGALSFSGDMKPAARKALTAALSFAGATRTQASKMLSGAMSFVGGLGTIRTKLLSIGGALSFSGGMKPAMRKVLGGALSFAGALRGQARKIVAGALSFAGGMKPRMNKMLAGAVGFTGNMIRSVWFHVVGVLAFSGALQAVRQGGQLFLQSVAGALGFTGSLSTAVTHLYLQSIAGALGFAGALRRQPAKFLAGGLAFAGSLRGRTNKMLGGALSFSQSMTRATAARLLGTLVMTGAVRRDTAVRVLGSLSFLSSMTPIFGIPLRVLLALGALVVNAVFGLASLVALITDKEKPYVPPARITHDVLCLSAKVTTDVLSLGAEIVGEA